MMNKFPKHDDEAPLLPLFTWGVKVGLHWHLEKKVTIFPPPLFTMCIYESYSSYVILLQNICVLALLLTYSLGCYSLVSSMFVIYSLKFVIFLFFSTMWRFFTLCIIALFIYLIYFPSWLGRTGFTVLILFSYEYHQTLNFHFAVWTRYWEILILIMSFFLLTRV